MSVITRMYGKSVGTLLTHHVVASGLWQSEVYTQAAAIQAEKTVTEMGHSFRAHSEGAKTAMHIFHMQAIRLLSAGTCPS